MKILVCCNEGNNRSVTIAHRLKYWGHDVLPCGIDTNSLETLEMLYEWADRIIITEPGQMCATNKQEILDKYQLWDVGPDTYPRPFNKDLDRKVKRLMAEHEAEYKS